MKTTGAILAGGKSTRMKFHKAFAEIGGKQVIEIIIDKFTRRFEETIIISNEPYLFHRFGLPIYQDIFPYLGPVAGIHAALERALFDPVFVLGCDMPFINMKMVDHMIGLIGDYDSVVTRMNSTLQPTAAVYSKKCLPIFQNYLEDKRLKLTRIVEEDLNSMIIDEQELRLFGPLHEQLFNVNDPQALEHARSMAGRLL
ncbi:MAG: molybdenum cofactor guanylyltransferase [Syntrophomonadaceae bacterium]|nr:molybdenum cofactor guanylyltransferase [Syntrophomonadaceae bacterium]